MTHKDGFWWCTSAILGSLAYIVPLFLKIGSSEDISFDFAVVSLLLLGVVIGFLRPTRPWRWGLASVLLLPFTEIVSRAIKSYEMTDQSVSIISIISYVLVMIPIYALIALPAVVGAYIGSYFKKRTLKPETKVKSKNISLPWIFGLILGLLISGLPILLIPIYEFPNLYPYWIGGLFTANVIMGITFQTRVWRWAVAVGLGLPIAVILKIIIDSIFGIMDHNLFPFEIIIALFIAAVSSYSGVFIGKLARKIIDKFRISRESEGT